MQNKVQYDLDRKIAKISAYLTGENLGLKPSTAEQAKFEYSPLGKFFNKGLDNDDQKEALFRRLTNIENARKNLIRGNNESIYLDHNLIVNMIKIRIKKQQNNNIDTKQLGIFDYLKTLSQEAKDLMDEIEDVNKDINVKKLAFIGSNREKFNFNKFKIPLNFLSSIYNGQIALKVAEFLQNNLYDEINELKYKYKSKNVKEEK